MRKNVTRSGAVALALAVALAVVAPARPAHAAASKTGAFAGAVTTYLGWYNGGNDTIDQAAAVSTNYVRYDIGSIKKLTAINVIGNSYANTSWQTYYSQDGSSWSSFNKSISNPSGFLVRYVEARVTSTTAAAGSTGIAWVAQVDGTLYVDSTPPAIPANFRATNIGYDSVALAWDTVGDADLDHYVIYQNGTTIYQPGKLDTTATITGLTPNAAYSYTIASADTTGNVSAQSAAVNVTTTLPPAPATPTGLTGAPTGKTSVHLTWTAVSDPYLQKYRLYRDGAQIAEPPAGVTTYDDTGLTQGTTYLYSIAAVDNYNQASGISPDVSVTTDATPPATPTGLAASPTGPTSITLTWTANSEPDLKEYRLYRDGAVTATVTAPATSYSDTNLTPATTYSYQIAAINNTNQASGISTAVTATTPDAATPTTPTGLAASLAGPNAVALTWTANPEPDIAKYRLYRDGTQLTEVTAPATGYTDSTVQQGQTYLYSIAAVSNFNKASGISADVSITVPDVTPPAAPTGLTATATYATAVDLTWTANLEPDLKEYRVYRNGSYLATVTAPAHSMTDTTAAPATMYSYEVSAVDNADNESTRSNLVSATTPEATASTPPPTPAGFTATASTGSVRLAWSPAPTAQSYTIWRNGKLLTTVAVPATSYTDPNLQKGTYSYTIAASNAAGSSVPASTQATLVIGFFEWTIDLTGLTDKTSLVLASLGSILLVILGLIVGLGIVQYVASRAREVR